MRNQKRKSLKKQAERNVNRKQTEVAGKALVCPML